MAAVERWCTISIARPDGSRAASFDLAGSCAPDLAAVDLVARLKLVVARLGGKLSITEVSPALASLLQLAGLSIEVQREPELGEEPLGFQQGKEETHLGDLAP